MKKIIKNNGITLVALVITIIILLILAGISIAQLTGSGLFENARLAEEKSKKAEMAESLTLALQELQLEKKGKATIDDITQEWLDNKLSKYNCTVTENAENNSKTITMEKDGLTVGYELNENLGITSNENVAVENKVKIELSNIIVSTSTTATESDEPGKLSKGTPCYINFTPSILTTSSKATVSEESEKLAQETTVYTKLTSVLDEVQYTITPEVPYKVLGNGTYTFTVIAIYDGETVTEEVKVDVNQYVAPIELVQYDAGEWTEDEITKLEDKSLYDINVSKTKNSTFKLNDSTGLNFTFGGFTYKGDATNANYINNGTIVTSRNQSIAPQSGQGTPQYDGWQILDKETKTDQNGNTIKNEDGTERIYVTKIMHAGSPENFVYNGSSYDAYRAEYLLSKGERQTGYSTLRTGEIINTRNWDMYKDKNLDSKGYIKEVHAMTHDEAYGITGSSDSTTGIRNIGVAYWVVSTSDGTNFRYVYSYGKISATSGYCFGIRPVIEMNDGVYIASGDGTAASPYVLGKE